MTNTQKFAQAELELLSKSNTDPNNRPIIEPFIPEILALCEKFGLSGQSGGSVSYTATAISQAIKKLLLQNPICPIMGTDDEWSDVKEINNRKPYYQNKRCSSVFKEGKNGKAYYLDAIIFNGDITGTFTSNGSIKLKNGTILTSRQSIKSFPFTPYKFYIDVIETEWADKDEKVKKQGGGWWTSILKNEKDLKQVFKYYDRKDKS